MFNLQTIAIAVLAAVVAYLLVKKLLAVDKTVDVWQEEVGEFAGWLASKKLHRLADVFRSISAINVSGAVQKIRQLRLEIMQAEDKHEKFLDLIRPCFYDVLPQMLDEKHPTDTKAIVKAILDSPSGRRELAAQQQQQETPAP